MKIYIETSCHVYKHVANSADILSVARHYVTNSIWNKITNTYECNVSVAVIADIIYGDYTAEEKASMMYELREMKVLEVNEKIQTLVNKLLFLDDFYAATDSSAYNLAIPIVYNVDLILTWELRNFINAFNYKHVERIIAEEGYKLPLVCSPNDIYYISDKSTDKINDYIDSNRYNIILEKEMDYDKLLLNSELNLNTLTDWNKIELNTDIQDNTKSHNELTDLMSDENAMKRGDFYEKVWTMMKNKNVNADYKSIRIAIMRAFPHEKHSNNLIKRLCQGVARAAGIY